MKSGFCISFVMGLILFITVFLLLLVTNGLRMAIFGGLLLSIPFGFGVFVGFDICQKSYKNDTQESPKDKGDK